MRRYLPLREIGMKGVVTDSDLRYLDHRGNLLRSRAEFSTSNILSFLGHDYEYNTRVNLDGSNYVDLDFKIGDKYIEVIDSEPDLEKFKLVQRSLPDIKILGIGHSNYVAKQNELKSFFSFNSQRIRLFSCPGKPPWKIFLPRSLSF